MSVLAPEETGFGSPMPRGRAILKPSRLLPPGGEKRAENIYSPSINDTNSNVSNSIVKLSSAPGCRGFRKFEVIKVASPVTISSDRFPSES